MLVDLESTDGEPISLNPYRVVSVRQKKLTTDPDEQPRFSCTLTMAGGSKEIVKGSKVEVSKILNNGTR